jgi:hypothetical protein
MQDQVATFVMQQLDHYGYGWITCRMIEVAGAGSYPSPVHMGLNKWEWPVKERREQQMRVFLQIDVGDGIPKRSQDVNTIFATDSAGEMLDGEKE